MKRRAFSLIEIVQTIVLLGIIAGLAVSFFKNFSPNDKIYFSTLTLLDQAVQQAKRDMCNDQTPAYKAADNVVTLCDTTQCNNILNGSTYNEKTGYCEKTLDAADAALGCSAGISAKDTDGDNIIDLCYTVLTNTVGGTPYTCQPVREFFCPVVDNVRFSNTNRQSVTNTAGQSVPILCYYLYQTLNHKTQATNAADVNTDLIRTCNIGNAWSTAFDNRNLNQAGITAAIAAPQNNHYSMLLPNGARLYNLGQTIAFSSETTDTNSIKIFVKYDGVDDIGTSVFSRAGDTDSNIKNSTVWAIQVSEKGVVSSCAAQDEPAAPVADGDVGVAAGDAADEEPEAGN